MSLIFGEELEHAIKKADNEKVVALLEPRMANGSATECQRLLCGVLLMMPPIADYRAASVAFSNLLQGARRFEAAVWDAYRFAVLMPDDLRSFQSVLRSMPQSAIAAHMLSLAAAAYNDPKLALIENRRSIALRPFPFNITFALRRDPDLPATVRGELWQIACDLIISRSAETDPSVRTAEAALQRRWDNLIIGTRITSELWREYSRIFGKEGLA